jgi:hypothetical protein
MHSLPGLVEDRQRVSAFSSSSPWCFHTHSPFLSRLVFLSHSRRPINEERATQHAPPLLSLPRLIPHAPPLSLSFYAFVIRAAGFILVLSFSRVHEDPSTRNVLHSARLSSLSLVPSRTHARTPSLSLFVSVIRASGSIHDLEA